MKDNRTTSEQTQAYRTRGWVMPLCGVLTSLFFCLMLPVWCRVYAGIPPVYLLLLGVLLSVVAIPLHLLGSTRKVIGSKWRKPLFLCLSITVNTLGTSLCMGAYYIHIASKPLVSHLIAGALVALTLHGITALLMQIWPDRYALLTGIIALLAVALSIVSIVFWVKNDNKIFFSFAFFNLLWTLISVIALHVACSDETSPALRFASFASFGILIAVAAIVLAILACAGGDCDCDCGDGCCDCNGCDCGGGDKPSKKTTRKYRKRLWELK